MNLSEQAITWIFTTFLLGQVAGLVAVSYVVKLTLTGSGWWVRREPEDQKRLVHGHFQ